MNIAFSNILCKAFPEVSLVQSLPIALMGILIVFCVLVLLMLMIWIMGKISDSTKDFASKHPKYEKFVNNTKAKFTAFGNKIKAKFKKTTVENIEKESKAPLAEGTCGELKLIKTSESDAAMIMAIVADSTNTPLNELRFKSIKNISEGENK